MFFEVTVYKEEDTQIQLTFYCKPTDQQTYLHAKLEHLKSLKDSIPYSQAFREKSICSAPTEYEKHCTTIRNKFKESGYSEPVSKESN